MAIEYFLCFVLFGIGFYGLLVKRNVVKMIIAIGIMDYALNLFLVLIGFKFGAEIPILAKSAEVKPVVDPLAQAMVLTTIVIGLAITILLAGVALRLFEKYGTFDITRIRKLNG